MPPGRLPLPRVLILEEDQAPHDKGVINVEYWNVIILLEQVVANQGNEVAYAPHASTLISRVVDFTWMNLLEF